MSDPITADNYLEDEVCASLRLTKRTLRLWRQRRIGPPWAAPTRRLIVDLTARDGCLLISRAHFA